jgi:S-adenosylmethionine synthetase
MFRLALSTLEIEDAVEIVERKGAGHPDSICDALAEALSRNLCAEYHRRFGSILHHNVDKALLCGGRARAAFGGGEVTTPIRIYLAGRAVTEVGSERVPLQEIAVDGSRRWLKANLHALDAKHHVRIETMVQQGSDDLQSLFARRDRNAGPLANDTSFGVGHAPLSALERLVLTIERQLHERNRDRVRPAWGEDTKIMAVRQADRLYLTVACAMIGRHMRNCEDYRQEKAALADWVLEIAATHGFSYADVRINAADDMDLGSIYLTVTGTSAEAGDDGQVGRGNRVNGLITPGRPMSLEAAAGKNPVNHVGKIYNVLANDIAQTLVASMPEVSGAQCLIVSRIGAPVSQPALTHIKLGTHDGTPLGNLNRQVEELVASRLERIPELINGFIAGAIDVF